jgi:hypothetical protein
VAAYFAILLVVVLAILVMELRTYTRLEAGDATFILTIRRVHRKMMDVLREEA